MNKLKLLGEAERLYEVENLNADKIAEKLNISRRTVFNWMKKYEWKQGRVKIKDLAEQLAPNLYSMGSKLI